MSNSDLIFIFIMMFLCLWIGFRWGKDYQKEKQIEVSREENLHQLDIRLVRTEAALKAVIERLQNE